MGYLLRRSLLVRVKALLLQPREHEISRSISSWHKLSAYKNGNETAEPSQDSSPGSIEESYISDVNKFGTGKLSLPKTDVKQENYAMGPPGDPDSFGTMVKSNPYLLRVYEGADGDKIEEEYTSELPNYLPQKQYAQMINKYLRQRRFSDALNVLQVTMLKEHRVQPEYYIYNILISHCGMTGYTKMAFKLYSDMKRRSLPVHACVFTSLFNSCANSPFPSDGLNRTRKLLTEMNEKEIQPNEITCHAIIKAFGRCGSLEEAFKFVDYMMSRKMSLKAEAFNFLFHGCISDKEAGFRHALLVHRKMIQYKITPDIYHFNLLLRCVRECGIGDMESTVDTLEKLGVKDVHKLTAGPVNTPVVDSGYAWDEKESFMAEVVVGSSSAGQQPVQDSSVSTQTHHPNSLLPNLLSESPTLGCIVRLSEIATPQDRLFLLGGVEGFMKEMAKYDVKLDVKTISLLLECIPDTCPAEEAFMEMIEKLKVKTDLLFYNTLIRRRAYRRQYTEAKEILRRITKNGFQPDMMTFVNLAMTCRDVNDASELLKAVDQSGLRPNIELLSSLLGNARKRCQTRYANLILDVIDYEGIELNERFTEKIEKFYQDCQQLLKDKTQPLSSHHRTGIQNFCGRYSKWIKDVPKQEKTRPWQELKEKYPEESQQDEEFLRENVEKFEVERNFPRLGPSTGPKQRKAKIKKMKAENPEAFKKRISERNIVEKLVGIPSVQYQAALTTNRKIK